MRVIYPLTIGLVSIFSVALTACDSNVFGSRTPTGKSDAPVAPTSPVEVDAPTRGTPTTPTIPDPKPPAPIPPPFPISGPDKPDITDPPPVNLCPDGAGAFSVLIVDLKSGWFAGDGGNFFKGFVNSKCKDTVKLNYLHVTKELVEGNVEQNELNSLLPCATSIVNGRKEFSKFDADKLCQFGSFTEYDQLWLLGGSTVDSVDIGTTSNLFKSLLDRARELYDTKPNSGFFIGAGLRNTIHANVFAASVFPTLFPSGKLFINFGENDKIIFPNPTELVSAKFKTKNLVAGTGLTAGTFLSSAPALLDLNTLPDYENVAGRTMISWYKGNQYSAAIDECLGNPIYAPNGKPVLKVIATDHCNQPIIATGEIGAHKVLAEGNMARFYKTSPESYFHRIILSLL